MPLKPIEVRGRGISLHRFTPKAKVGYQKFVCSVCGEHLKSKYHLFNPARRRYA